MEAAHTSPSTVTAERLPKGERKCIATGEVRPKDDLIRFVVGPDASVVPDLAQNLPGRGLWVSADRESITNAARKNLFARAAKTSATADPDLADQVAKLLRKRCLEFLGLARRSGIAVLGQPQVEAALKTNNLGLLLIADDASQTIDNNRNHVPENRRFDRNELGAAFGHDQIVYAALKRQALTGKLIVELARLEKITGTQTSSEMDSEKQ